MTDADWEVVEWIRKKIEKDATPTYKSILLEDGERVTMARVVGTGVTAREIYEYVLKHVK